MDVVGLLAEKVGSLILLYCLTPETINGSLQVKVQGEVIEQSFGEDYLCFRTLQRFYAATLWNGMNPPISPQPQWQGLWMR